MDDAEQIPLPLEEFIGAAPEPIAAVPEGAPAAAASDSDSEIAIEPSAPVEVSGTTGDAAANASVEPAAELNGASTAADHTVSQTEQSEADVVIFEEVWRPRRRHDGSRPTADGTATSSMATPWYSIRPVRKGRRVTRTSAQHERRHHR